MDLIEDDEWEIELVHRVCSEVEVRVLRTSLAN